jgi:hypothetical protein
MVERWAMTGKYEFSASDNGRDPFSKGDASSNQEVRKLLKRAEQAAVTIIQDNDRRLRAVAQALIEKESLNIDEVARLAGLTGLEGGDDDDGFSSAPRRDAQGPLEELMQQRQLSGYGSAQQQTNWPA